MQSKARRGAALMWAWWSTVAIAMAIGIVCRGLTVTSKYKTVLAEQTAYGEIANWATAKRTAEYNGHTYARIDISTAVTTTDEFFACPEYPDNLLLCLVSEPSGAKTDSNAVFSRESFKLSAPQNTTSSDEACLDMGDVNWRLSEAPTYSDATCTGILQERLTTPAGLDIGVYNSQSGRKSGIAYAIRQPSPYQQTVVAGDSNTFYNRGTGRWMIQAVDIETGAKMRELKLDTSSLPAGKYNNNHAWYLTAGTAPAEKRYIVISDGAPVIVSPSLLLSPDTAPTLSIGNSALIIGDISDFPENP